MILQSPGEVRGPFGPKVEKRVESEFATPSDSGVRKVETKPKKSRKESKISTFKRLFFDSDLNFLGPTRKFTGTHFQLSETSKRHLKRQQP